MVSAGAASGADEADAPPSAGTAVAVDLWLAQNGTRSALADGSILWRLTVRCADCLWMSATVVGFKLPPGARLFVHGEGGVGAHGAYSAANNAAHGTFGVPPLPGRELTLEYHGDGASEPAPPTLRLTEVLAGSSVAFAARPPNEASYDPLRRSVDASGGCMVDAACEPAWARARAASSRC